METHLARRQLERIAVKAGHVDDLLDGIALVRHTSETGEAIRSPGEAAFLTGLREAARSSEQLYVLQIARLLGSTLDGLAFSAHEARIENIPYFSEFYGMFNNDDRYLRSRRTWSLYGRR